MLAHKTIKSLGRVRPLRNGETGSVKYYRGADRKMLQALLRDHGFRSTEGRLSLLSILKSTHEPLSVPGIARRCNANLDTVNVYRSLEALAVAGILVRTDLRRGGAHYEFKHDHHHHIVCTDCGTMKDFNACDIEKVMGEALKQVRAFATVDSHSLELFGKCNSCVSV